MILLSQQERYLSQSDGRNISVTYVFRFLQPKMPRQRLTASVSEDRDDIEDSEQNSAAKRGSRVSSRRSRRKRTLADLYDDKKIEDDETGPILSAHKQISLGINLSEINRKLIAVNPVFG